MKYICKDCGVICEVSNMTQIAQNKKRCDKCLSEYRRKLMFKNLERFETTCEECGKPIISWKNSKSDKVKKFCSKNCSSKHYYKTHPKPTRKKLTPKEKEDRKKQRLANKLREESWLSRVEVYGFGQSRYEDNVFKKKL